MEAQPTTAHAIETVFRLESPRVIAGVARIVRDVGIAEELAQDALVAALERWPREGVPDNPGAWLTATARHRAVDLVRRRETYARKLAAIGRDLETAPPAYDEPADPDDIDDDLLRLVFTAWVAWGCPHALSSGGGSSAPSAPWPRRTSPSRCRTDPTARPASARCWTSST